MYSLSNDAFILGHGTVWTGDFVAIFLIKENWTAVYNRLGLLGLRIFWYNFGLSLSIIELFIILPTLITSITLHVHVPVQSHCPYMFHMHK